MSKKLCGNEGCTGLAPCVGCVQLRVQIMEHAVKAAAFPEDKAQEFLKVAQVRCDVENCSGLEPCNFCRDVRIGFTIGLFRAAQLSKKQIEDFNIAYGEAFEGCIGAVRKMREDLAKERVEERVEGKEALDKEPESTTKAPDAAASTPTTPSTTSTRRGAQQARSTRASVVQAPTETKNGTTPQTSKPEENPPASSSHTQE